MKGLVSAWRAYQLPLQAVSVGQTAHTKRKFKIHSCQSLGLSVQSTPNSLYICIPGVRAILPTLLGHQQSPSCSPFQTPLIRVGFKPMTSVVRERLQNFLSTCGPVQSFHIKAHANACFEHRFVRSTASLVFGVRAEISGSDTEQVFQCSGGLRSKREGVPRRDLSSSDCTTRRCVCSVPYVFMTEREFILKCCQLWGWSTDEWKGRLVFLMASYLHSQEENLSWRLVPDSDFCWAASPGVCCVTSQWNPLSQLLLTHFRFLDF